jgi:hypothetical protein
MNGHKKHEEAQKEGLRFSRLFMFFVAIRFVA